MTKKKAETKVIYIIFDSQNNIYARKYLSKVESLTEIIKELLNISPKRKDINYFNELTNMTDSQLQKEYEKCLNY